MKYLKNVHHLALHSLNQPSHPMSQKLVQIRRQLCQFQFSPSIIILFESLEQHVWLFQTHSLFSLLLLISSPLIPFRHPFIKLITPLISTWSHFLQKFSRCRAALISYSSNIFLFPFSLIVGPYWPTYRVVLIKISFRIPCLKDLRLIAFFPS